MKIKTLFLSLELDLLSLLGEKEKASIATHREKKD
jgi:hypothetical protein